MSTVRGAEKATRVEADRWMLVKDGRGDRGSEIWGVVMHVRARTDRGEESGMGVS